MIQLSGIVGARSRTWAARTIAVLAVVPLIGLQDAPYGQPDGKSPLPEGAISLCLTSAPESLGWTGITYHF